MDLQLFLREISQKEIDYGCYDAKIDGVPVYSRIRRLIRKQLIREAGVTVMELRKKVKKKKAIISIVISFFDLCKILFLHSKKDTVFMAFPRVDNVNGIYMDKFTDPLIETGGFGEDYIVFEHGFGGTHKKPRMHNKHIVYVDFVKILCLAFVHFGYKRFCKKHNKELSIFFNSLEKAFGGDWNRKLLVKELAGQYASTIIYYWLFKRLNAIRVIGPARDYLTKAFVPAKKLHMQTFELQHGITYGETEMYSGYRDEMVLPDYFLAFGDNKPSDVYGIDESRIVNIGWALQDYIDALPHTEYYGADSVLVISDPEITDAIIHTILMIAESHPEIKFYIRPHPHEVICEKYINLISKIDNVEIQDKRINISVVLQRFDNIIGENSTVLYEALAIGKKVGKLFFEGLNPKYLEESDRDCFWEIKCLQDFDTFIASDNSTKKSKCIYSKFNKDLFFKTLGLK